MSAAPHSIPPAGEQVAARWRRLEGATFLLCEGPRPESRGVHSHEHIRVCFLLKGTITEIDDSGRSLERGPFSTHTSPIDFPHAHLFTSERLATICFDIEPHMQERLGDSVRVFQQPLTIKRGAVATMIPRFHREILTRDTASDLVLQGLIYEFTGELVRRKSNPLPSDAPGWLRQARELLSDAWRENIGVEDVARAVGVHPSHLVRVFRTYMNLSPGEYLRRVRLEHATREVLMTDKPLKVIAAMAGFADQAHFSRAFKKHHGVSPDQFRRAAR